jgi:hypothetical protein
MANLPPPPAADLIPQPQVPTEAPVATSLKAETKHFALSLNQENKTKTTIKGGLVLLFDPTTGDGEEESMEERRARLPQYQKMLA